ncbi:MAG TPA: hypothetical protein VIL86_17305 [Tepidisphaeraceae bacterium]|jgi:hypothetical protein
MSEITREQFVERVLEVVRGKFPLVKIARAPGQSFSLRVNGNIASLENLYRMSVLNPLETKRHVERWMVELLRAAEGFPDQAGAFEEVKDRILPMLLDAEACDFNADAMTTQPFVNGLVIAYAVDSDRTIAYIPRAVFQKWGLSIDDLHDLALANLSARSEAINAHAAQDEKGKVNLILFQTMDGYYASRLLLPNLHERDAVGGFALIGGL